MSFRASTIHSTHHLQKHTHPLTAAPVPRAGMQGKVHCRAPASRRGQRTQAQRQRRHRSAQDKTNVLSSKHDWAQEARGVGRDLGCPCRM